MALQQIDKMLKHLDKLNSEITKTQKQIESDIEITFKNCVGDNQKRSLAYVLYWEYPNISTSLIAQGLGLNNENNVHKVVGTSQISVVCSQCKENDVQVEVTSRSDMQQKKRIRRNYIICEQCKSAKEEAQRKADAKSKQYMMQIGLRIQELKEMDYKDYLLTPEWDETRKKMLRHANYKCQLCNANKITLNVHHKNYERLGEEYYNDLIVLCKNCHAKFHDKEIST